MASKINKKYSADIKGVLSVDDGIITIQVEDMDESVVLADFIKDFADKEIKLVVSYGEEL
jgi:hypothetical protein